MAKVTKRVGRPLGRSGIPKLPLSSFRTVKPAIAKYYKNRFIYDELNPLPLQLGAVAWWQFSGSNASSDIIEGATSTDVAGWKDKAFTNVKIGSDLWVEGSEAYGTGWSSGGLGVYICDGTQTGFSSVRVNTGSSLFNRPTIVEFTVDSITSGSVTMRVGGSPVVFEATSVGTYELVLISNGIDPNLRLRASDDFVGQVSTVSAFELDPATVAYDLSQNTASAQPTFTQPDGPVVFDGNDYLEGVPNKTGDFTYAIKYKFNAETAPEILLGESTSENNILATLPVDDKIRVRPSNGVSMDFSVTQTPTVEYVLILTRSGNDYTCYMDGVSLGTQVNTSDFRPEWLCGRQSLNTLLNGDLYEVSYYDRALNSTEIAQLNAYMG